MFCTKCGKEIHDEAVVCIHCGCPVPGSPYAPPINNTPKKQTTKLAKNTPYCTMDNKNNVTNQVGEKAPFFTTDIIFIVISTALQFLTLLLSAIPCVYRIIKYDFSDYIGESIGVYNIVFASDRGMYDVETMPAIYFGWIFIVTAFLAIILTVVFMLLKNAKGHRAHIITRGMAAIGIGDFNCK